MESAEMMDIQESQSSQILRYEDFEPLRCDECREYLNCPNIMMYVDRPGSNKPFQQCGRCYNKTTFDENAPKPIRNISAEMLAAVTPFPCRYYSNGCRERRIWPKLELHEQECMFRIFECPLFKQNPSLYLTGMEIIRKYREAFPNLILCDGVLTVTFDRNFELPFLIQQNSDLFMCTLKYDVNTDKGCFTINLMENRSNSECSIEFSNSNQAVTLKTLPNTDDTMVDLKAIKALLLCDNAVLKCRVYLNPRLLAHPASELLKEIQCPSCWDYMKGRIYMCSNGHSVCMECKKNLQSCPICREASIQTTRNFSLEKVISQAYFPCNNHGLGCSYISTLDEIICHQKYCKFKLDDD